MSITCESNNCEYIHIQPPLVANLAGINSICNLCRNNGLVENQLFNWCKVMKKCNSHPLFSGIESNISQRDLVLVLCLLHPVKDWTCYIHGELLLAGLYVLSLIFFVFHLYVSDVCGF